MRRSRITLALGMFAMVSIAVLALAKLVTGANSFAPVAPANIAVIDSSMFADEKLGIGRVNSGLKQLEGKYKPIQTDIQTKQQQLATMKSDLQKKAQIQAASATAQQQEQIERFETDLKRRAEDATASYQRDYTAAMNPLQKDIATSLDAYAKAKGINLIIDVNRVPVIYVADSLDVTKDFIAEYNRTHPATGAPTTPARP